ncbi:c-type cytochrome [Psychroserpens luteolus]|uniref:c-type cytochrome n=1 Tax=Psychroserpens luteolus TaxID=2855840 RepID=UPI001E37A9C6|nr:cytochrome c [Psychroserpens luteolus]MCD2258634.1 cytochrome c [Psychroserpens luteolus]
MKSLFKIIVVLMVFASVVACKNDTRPNYQFMPNMYEPVSYEAYQEAEIVVDGQQMLIEDMEAQLPAEGSIPRGGHMPFEIENTNEGYILAKETLTNPLDSTQIDNPRGGRLYDIYCGICHGKKGDGQGNLVKREKILGVPSYDDAGRAITVGSIYHTIYYGKNSMGSYANQLNEEERWQVVDYVLKLKADLEK